MTLTIAGDPAQRPPYVVFFDANVLINRTVRVRIARRDDYYRLLVFMAGDAE